MPRPTSVLRSVRELEQYRVRTADGKFCGRIRDLYFDDSTWKIVHLLLSIEPTTFGRKEVLLQPSRVRLFLDDSGVIELGLSSADVQRLPLASSVLPVCKQYAAFAFSSPGARQPLRVMNPNLRSVKAVLQYRLETEGENSGALSDFLYHTEQWEIRYLAVEQLLQQKRVRFHLLPQSVERFSWTTQRILLHHLEPVTVSLGGMPDQPPSVAVA